MDCGLVPCDGVQAGYIQHARFHEDPRTNCRELVVASNKIELSAYRLARRSIRQYAFPMPTPADKTMFEIYREADYGRQFRVVFFTDLDEHNKEAEINRAMAGEHVYDGFLVDRRKDEGKKKLAEIIARLNKGEAVTAEQIERELTAIEAMATS